ncbi:hypothetical protein [Corynebacterium freneyi]|uniref:hypothetical protein n=1 Tax=Corynebacterium freneyi TaxID=134034 RepID=UPI001CD02701|nr:hypothetical protein [Corynebacterium freneyi]UBI01895.1 hypothetical protein LA334_10385 [Corynebacterium freneyi]
MTSPITEPVAPAAPAVPVAPAEPAEPVPPVEIPDVWEMPNRGSGWCDCGEDHEVDRPLVRRMIDRALGRGARDRDVITHPEVCRVIMDMWRYVEVCRFFHDAVERSAKAVHGRVEPKYPLTTGEAIIAHFAKTWNGCPEELCGGGFDWEGEV